MADVLYQEELSSPEYLRKLPHKCQLSSTKSGDRRAAMESDGQGSMSYRKMPEEPGEEVNLSALPALEGVTGWRWDALTQRGSCLFAWRTNTKRTTSLIETSNFTAVE